MLQLERDKASQERQLSSVKKQLEEETAKRVKLEKTASSYKSELNLLKDRTSKQDKELNKILTDLKNREWEVKQLESRQDKTIVEHVHVLEEAKRVTDRQLADTQAELQKQIAYIRSLEKAKTGLTREAEDLTRETERERLEIRAKEKAARTQEERATKALADFDKERKSREQAELVARRMDNELHNAKRQLEEIAQELITVQRSKANLETELDRLADETVSPNSIAKVQRDYETRIAQLEEQLAEGASSEYLVTKLRERVDKQHAEIRQLVMSGGGTNDSSFQNRLLQELQLMDQELDQDLSYHRNHPRSGSGRESINANATPSKRPRSRASSHSLKDEPSRVSEKQVTVLKQHVQVLELRIATSERVRQHLEHSIREMSAELEKSDGSKQALQQYRARLSRENEQLAALLAEEADARRAAEAAQVDGIQAVWDKFQQTIAQEKQNYTRLEESRKALVRYM